MMRKLKYLLLLSLIYTFSCQEKTEELVQPQENKVSKIILEKDKNLQRLLSGITSSNSNARQLNNNLGDLKLDFIVGSMNENGTLNYSIPINSQVESNISKNLIIAYRNQQYWGYILEFHPTDDKYLNGYEGFSGTMFMYDLQGELISSQSFTNGGKSEEQSASSSRINMTDVDCEWDTQFVRVDNWTGSSFGSYAVVKTGWVCEESEGGDGESGGDDGGDNWGTPIDGTPIDGGPSGGDGSTGGLSGGSNGDSFALTDPIAIKIVEIGQLISLSSDANTWLVNNPEHVNEIYAFLMLNSSSSAKSFAEKMMEYITEGTYGDQQAALMTFELSNRNRLNGSYDANYFNYLSNYTPPNIDIQNSNVQLLWMLHFTRQCAIIKSQNPNLSDWEVFWEASRETWHLMLDLGGLVPVVGEVCDITNALIYTIEGDGLNASLSTASAVPFAGWIASGVKLGFKGPWRLIVKANGDIYFGARKSEMFRKALGLVKGDGKHAHHLIPWSKSSHPLVQKAAKSKTGFHLNETLNGIPLPSGNHLTGHSAYTAKVTEILNEINASVTNSADAYIELTKFINYLKNLIKNNPNKSLGEIAALINY